MRPRLRRAAAAVLLVLLAGCTQAPAVTRSGDAPASTAPVIPPAPDSSNLAAAKRDAGIPDCPASDRGAAVVPEGLPDDVLPCLGGGRSVRLAGLRGKPLLVNVWAQWCGPCRDEAPLLAEVARAGTGDIAVIGIDHADPSPERAIAFAQAAGWTYPQLQDRDSLLRTDLQVAALPQTFFVRADGSIAYRNLRPFSSADQIRELSERYLGVRP